MKELTKKVVILNNFSSPYVSQAIIILKDYNPKIESKTQKMYDCNYYACGNDDGNIR